MIELVPDAGWCWFGDPRAVFHAGFVYYGWTDMAGGVWVAQYDTAAGVRRRFRVGAYAGPDDHGNPSLAVRGDRLVVFWAGHNAAQMLYRVATNPHSVAAWGPVLACEAGNSPGSGGFTYPNPVQPGDGQLWLFWRGGGIQPAYARTGSVTANSWTTARQLFAGAGANRPYVKVLAGPGVVHFAMTEAHPDLYATSIWYCRLVLADGTFRDAGGQLLGRLADVDAGTPLPVTALDRVYDGAAPGPRAWVWDLQLDAGGQPVIAFAGLASRTAHDYRVAHWGVGGWYSEVVCTAGGTIEQAQESNYSGGVAVDPLDTDRVVVSRPAGPGALHRLERWERLSIGWAPTAVLTTGGQQDVRPFFVRGVPAGAPLRLLWLSGTYGEFTAFGTRLVGATV